MKILLKRRIEQTHATFGGIYIILQKIHFAGSPIFSNCENIFIGIFSKFVKPFFVKYRRLVFHSIQTKSVKMNLAVIPFSPFVEFFAHEWVSVVDIVVHQIIIIPFFSIDHFFPTITEIVDDLVNSFFLTFRIIYARKAGKIPFEV